jgi:hypothetical protein
MSAVLWLVGEPGAGKTTLARQIIEVPSKMTAKPKWTIGSKVVAAGHYTGGKFDGADTVPYNGAKEALAFWREMLAHKAELTLLDGDRFSNATAVEFFKSYVGPGGRPRLLCVLLKPSAELAAERRKLRGSDQNETWLKGRVTKANNFYEGFPADDRATLHANFTDTPEHLAFLLRTFLGKMDLVLGKV